MGKTDEPGAEAEMNRTGAIAALAVAVGTPALIQPQEALAAEARPVYRIDLEGGAKALLVEDHTLEQVHFGVTLRVGSAADPPGLEGLARATTELLLLGAGSRTRAQIEETVDSLGSTLEVDAGQTSLSLDGDALTRNLEDFLELLADVLLHPTFPEAELARLARETTSEIENLRDNDQALASRFFRRHVFGDHPYARPTIGTTASIKAITRADVLAFYKQHFVAPNIVISAAGDISSAAFREALSKHFGALPAGAAGPTAPSLPAAPRPSGRKVILVDKPERTQTQILLGHEGISASDPDFHALEVVNTAFGGTFTARLMEEIRVRNGWSYGAYSRIGADRDTGNFYMWIFPKTQDAIQAATRTIELYEELARDGLSDGELEFAKGYLVNTHGFETDTAAKHVDELVRQEVLGLPADFLDTYVAKIKAITPEAARAVITKRLHPNDLVITILCTASTLESKISLLPGVRSPPTVVPHDAD
jgi:zinc protease